MSDDDGTTVYVSKSGGEAEVVYSHPNDGGVAALSRDETLLAIAHSEHGDSRHTALRVLSVDGATVAEKWDGEGKGLDAVAFSPVRGDQRLLVIHERRGREELLIWDVEADSEVELHVDLPGEVTAAWYPDGRSILVLHTHEARNTVHRYNVKTGELSTLDTLPGTISSAGARPDGTVEYAWSSGAEPSVVRALYSDGTGTVLLTPPGDGAPGSVPLTDAFVPTANGTVHALVARPESASRGRCPPCSACTAARTPPTRTGSPPTGRSGWTPVSPSCTSTTAARPATARPGGTPSRAGPA